MDSKKSELSSMRHVVAVPFPGRGDINPMFSLCHSLTSLSPNILVTFVVTEEWLHLFSSHSKTPRLNFASISNVLPSELVRADDLLGFFDAVMTKMEAPFDQLLDRLQPPPDLIMADTCLSWALRAGNRRNIPVASFFPLSAAFFSVFHYFSLLELHGDFPFDVSVKGNERVEYIPGLSSTRFVEILGPTGGTYDYFLQRLLEAFSVLPKAQHLLVSTVYELERQAVDALKADLSIPVYTIGPAIPASESGEEDYFGWLDQQPENSVLYVSMGSHLSASERQMDEIVGGLSESGVRFMLVARSKADELIETGGEKGLVVPWCNQLRVLSHKSVGGFWSHCGWNSVKEGIMAGVPFITSPIVADQFMNSKLVVEDWKIGVRLQEDIKTETLVTRHEISEMVRKFMDLENDDGKRMRTRAKELQKAMSIGSEGSSQASLNSFINHISSS